MQPILNMKRRVGEGLLWIPVIGLPLVCIELFTNREISDDDRALCWTILLSHVAECALMWVFCIGLVISVICLVYAILTFCGKSHPEMPFLAALGKKFAVWTKPACECAPAASEAEKAPEAEQL